MALVGRILLRLGVGALVIVAWFAAGLRVDPADRAANEPAQEPSIATAPRAAPPASPRAGAATPTATPLAAAPPARAPLVDVAPTLTPTPPALEATTGAPPPGTGVVAEPLGLAAAPIELRDRVLALIPFPWQERLPGWTVELMPARYDVHGLTFTGEARIELYVRPTDDADILARVLAHELGHAADLTLNDDTDRAAWLDQRGIDGAPWWPGEAASDFASGAGDFAECFSTWQVGSTSRSEIAGPCRAEDLTVLISLVG